MTTAKQKSIRNMTRARRNPAKPVEYDPASVDAAIAASNRAGRHIGGKERKLIHRLLQGRKATPLKRNPSTSTSADVSSPTRTSTSTKADTRGNVTVTGGAGRGATTSVTLIRRNPSFVPRIHKGGYWYVEAKAGRSLLYVQSGPTPIKSSFVKSKAAATHFKSQHSAGDAARKLLPYLDERIDHLKVVR